MNEKQYKRNLHELILFAGKIINIPFVGNGDVNMVLKNVRTSLNTNISLKNIPDVKYILLRQCGLFL